MNFTAYFDPFKGRWFSQRVGGAISSRRAGCPSSPWERTKWHFEGRALHWEQLVGKKGARSSVRHTQGHTPPWSGERKKAPAQLWCLCHDAAPTLTFAEPQLPETRDPERGSGFTSKNQTVCASSRLFSANENMTQLLKTRRSRGNSN